MAFNAQGLMLRVVALEKEAMAALTPAVIVDAVPRFLWTQEGTPYFTNRLGEITLDDDGEDFDVVTCVVTMRLVIGHVTEGYVGEVDDKLQLWIPQIIQYVNERELMQSAAYPTPLDYQLPSRIVSARGYQVFRNDSIGAVQVGTEFTLQVRFEYDIEQAYL